MDDQISLNISSNDTSSKEKIKKKRTTEREVDEYDIRELSKKPRKRSRDAHTEEEGGGKKRKVGDGNWRGKSKTSSLWGGNPDVPALPKQKKNKKKQNPLFSEIDFSNAGLHPYMVSNLEKILGSSKMTEVQRRSIPVLISGKDALVRSQTGSGKTLAYSVPIIQALQEIRPQIQRNDGTLALIIVPTRELALQTYEWLVKLVHSFAWLVPGVLSGGEKKKSEKARMRRGVNILVSTPGRLLDHVTNTVVCNLGKVKYLVLDEADRMMDMGYERDVASIVTTLNTQGSTVDKRQTMLLSATLGPGVERLAGLVLKEDRVFIDASTEEELNNPNVDETMSVPATLEQWVLAVPAKLRLVALAAFIAAKCEMTTERKMLIFCATQDMVDYLTPLLASGLVPDEPQDNEDDSDDSNSDLEDEQGVKDEERLRIKTNIRFFRLHGNMTQKDRMEVFKTFRDADSGVLLCTDVASRGLDLPKVDWIVQLTAPPTPQDYVHRVGRTARVGVKGSAVLFLAPSELSYVDKLQQCGISLKEMDAERCLSNLLELIPEHNTGARKGRRKVWRPTLEGVATALQLRFENAVLEDKSLHDLACKAYISWVRFYASYPKEAKEYFHYKALHLGHYAKSFALRDPPSRIGGIGRRSWENEGQSGPSNFRRRSEVRNPRKTGPTSDRTKHLITSEYASGL